MTASGIKLGTLPYKAPARRLLIFCANQLQIGFRRSRSAEVPPPRRTRRGRRRPEVGGLRGQGDREVRHRDFKGAIEDFSAALKGQPASPASVYIYRATLTWS